MRARFTGALLAAPLLAGCITGKLYRHTSEPLDTNFDHTPVFSGANETGSASVDHVHVPLSSIDVDILWSSNAIGDVMKRSGLAEVYYADLETFSILGVWNQYTVHAYGKPVQ